MSEPRFVELALARREELAEVAALSARCFTHGAWEEEALSVELERPFAEVWVARVGGGPDAWAGSVVGYAVAWFVGDDGELLSLGTHPDVRRGGVGRALVERLQRSVRERAVRSLTLEVRDDNVAARHLYESSGFVTLDVRRRYYGDGMDARVMSWTP